MSSLGFFEVWPLVATAGAVLYSYAAGLFTLSPLTFLDGEFEAGRGAWNSLRVLYVLLAALAKGTWNLVRGHADAPLTWHAKLLSNIGLVCVALVANAVVFAAPPYLLWELFLAAHPVVLPGWFVFAFRAFVNFLLNLVAFILILVVLWFFVEEFTAGPNRVVEINDVNLNVSVNQQNDRTRRTMNEEEVQSKLTDVENRLRDDR